MSSDSAVDSSVTKSAARWLIPSVGSLALAALPVWHLLSRALANDRGLDLTDEGLYLLAANPSSKEASWLFPFGWHTAPLFRAVDLDIAAFRTLGAVILFAASCLLGLVASRAAVALAALPPRRLRLPSASIALTLGAAVGGIGSLMYYAGFLRTPSYNWANLLGMTLAATGQIMLATRIRNADRISQFDWGLIALTSFGLFFSVPARPSTAPMMLVAGGLLFTAFSNVRRGLRLTAVLVATTALWVVVAVAFRWWPSTFSAVFTSGIGQPSYLPSQTVTGAIRSLLLVPAEPFRQALGEGTSPGLKAQLLIGGLLTAIALIAVLLGRRGLRPLLHLACAGLFLTGLAIVRVPPMSASSDGFISWAHGPLVTACLLLLVSAILLTLGTWRIEDESGPAGATCLPSARDPHASRHSHWKPGLRISEISSLNVARLSLVTYLVVIPFFFGFGSSNGPYDQAAQAASFFLVAAVVTLTLRGPDWLTIRRALVVMFASLLLASAIIRDGHQHPYRIAPLQSHTETVQLNGQSIRVDPDLAAVVTSLGQSARQGGWEKGTPLVGLVWRWSSTLTFLLDGRPPDSLMLTIFGTEGSIEVARYNINRSADKFPFSTAWVISTATDTLNPTQLSQVSSVAELLSEETGRSFPRDYVCVAQVASFQLWRPGNPSDTNSQHPSRSATCSFDQQIKTNYDASVGWRNPSG